jgi:hypothetical protein
LLDFLDPAVKIQDLLARCLQGRPQELGKLVVLQKRTDANHDVSRPDWNRKPQLANDASNQIDPGVSVLHPGRAQPV